MEETISRFRNGFFAGVGDKDFGNSLAFNFIQIGEIVSKRISVEIRDKYPDLDKYRKFRNILTHEYFETDLTQIWILSNQLNQLRDLIGEIIARER